jgi:hypothetical protein
MPPAKMVIALAIAPGSISGAGICLAHTGVLHATRIIANPIAARTRLANERKSTLMESLLQLKFPTRTLDRRLTSASQHH